jgi:hypothetical protein
MSQGPWPSEQEKQNPPRLNNGWQLTLASLKGQRKKASLNAAIYMHIYKHIYMYFYICICVYIDM